MHLTLHALISGKMSLMFILQKRWTSISDFFKNEVAYVETNICLSLLTLLHFLSVAWRCWCRGRPLSRRYSASSCCRGRRTNSGWPLAPSRVFSRCSRSPRWCGCWARRPPKSYGQKREATRQYTWWLCCCSGARGVLIVYIINKLSSTRSNESR